MGSCLLFAIGCAADPSPSADTDPMTSGTSSGGDVESTGGPAPAPATDTSGATGPAGSDSGSSDDGADEAGFIPRPDVGPIGPGAPLGEQCEGDDDCESERCFMIPGAPIGFCSECALDSECMREGGAGTCGFITQHWAECTDGSAGMMCQGDAGCVDGLMCTNIFPGNPFLQCGECGSHDDCAPDLLCAPSTAGGTACLAAGTVENDAFCSAPDDGLCISTHCTESAYMGEPVGLFICGECTTDADCPEGTVCMPAEVTQTDAMGSACM